MIGMTLILGISVLVPQLAMAKRQHPTAALSAPTLISPSNGATVSGTVTFAWTAIAGAARYHIQVGSGTNFGEQSNIIENWSLTKPSYTFTITPGFVVYFPHLYWRVQAIDANNVQGPWSAVWEFRTTNP